MSWISNLVGAPVVDTVKAAGEVADALFTSDDERLSHAEVMEKIKQNPGQWQTIINNTEASSRNVFVAGWRPAVGWVCALGLLNGFLVNPWIQWATCLHGACITGPEIDMSNMIGLVTAMLGLGYLRTQEKKAGVAK